MFFAPRIMRVMYVHLDRRSELGSGFESASESWFGPESRSDPDTDSDPNAWRFFSAIAELLVFFTLK